MSRKIVRLTLDHLDALASPCRTCLFWELDPVRRERAEDPSGEKDAWVSEAPSYAQTVMTYDPGSPGALSYLEAAREIATKGAPS
jgi:cellulose biosynthesis protein BcsQ